MYTSQRAYSDTAVLRNDIVAFFRLSWQYQQPNNNLCDYRYFFLGHPSPDVLSAQGIKLDMTKIFNTD